jgi:hypothetical protein
MGILWIGFRLEDNHCQGRIKVSTKAFIKVLAF